MPASNQTQGVPRINITNINSLGAAGGTLWEELQGARSLVDQVAILNKPVQDLVGESTYDFIISGLPLNIFPVHLVREIYRVFKRVLKPGGTLSYFEYILVRELKSPFVSRRERRRLLSVGRVVGKYIGTYQIRQQRVFINVPPAVARHLRLKPLPDGDRVDHCRLEI